MFCARYLRNENAAGLGLAAALLRMIVSDSLLCWWPCSVSAPIGFVGTVIAARAAGFRRLGTLACQGRCSLRSSGVSVALFGFLGYLGLAELGIAFARGLGVASAAGRRGFLAAGFGS